MFRVAKKSKRKSERELRLRNTFMALDPVEETAHHHSPVPHRPVEGEVADAGDGFDAEQQPAEHLAGSDVESTNVGGGAWEDWQDGDADLVAVELLDVAGEDPVGDSRVVFKEGCGSDDEEVPVGVGVLPVARNDDDLCCYFAGLQSRREVPMAVVSDILEYITHNKEVFAESLLSGSLPTFRQMRVRAMKTVPCVFMDIVCKSPNGDEVRFDGVAAYPKKEIARRGLRKEYVLYYVRFEDVVQFHGELHEDCDTPTHFDLSVDGIPESKSGGCSLDVASIKFSNCKTVYSLAILQPDRRGMGIPESVTLQRFMNEYHGVGLRLRYVIADAPKRAALLGLMQHSSLYSCQYCVARKVDRSYGADSMGAERRTNASTRLIANAVASGTCPEDEAKGVKRVSPLAAIETLDIIRDIPAEKMHLVDLGIVRKIIRLAYKTPHYKARQVPFTRAQEYPLSELLLASRGLPNFARRTRPLDTANYKAEEFRNLAIAFWPLVYNTMPSCAANHWALTVFCYRALLLQDANNKKWLEKYDEAEVFRVWYVEFERIYGSENCSFNVHTFHHLPEVRSLAPLTVTSAMDYESHYNILKRSYRAGTCSTGQQALTNLLLALRYFHSCRTATHVTAKVTDKTDDSVCYVPGAGVLKVSSVDGTVLIARNMATKDTFEPAAGLNFNDVLCFKLEEPISLGPVKTYPLEDVAGKCVVADGDSTIISV